MQNYVDSFCRRTIFRARANRSPAQRMEFVQEYAITGVVASTFLDGKAWGKEYAPPGDSGRAFCESASGIGLLMGSFYGARRGAK